MSRELLDRRSAIVTALTAAANLASPAWAQSPRPDPLASRFGGPFSLVDHDGRRVTEKDFLGRYLVVYFGFTRCTDACPIDLPNIAAALDRIAPLDAEVHPLFITVDPDDTPERVRDFVRVFHPRMIGLTGSEAELAAVAKTYRVHRYRVQRQAEGFGPRHAVPQPAAAALAHGDKPHSPEQSFTIDHGTLTFVMGRDGKFLSLIPRTAGTDKIAEVLRTHVKA